MAMDTELLRTFLAITETGNFTLAGARVNKTQSAVSQQVKRLEATFGATLFQRSATEVSLTEAGRILLPHARRIVAAQTDALADFGKSDTTGTIAVGMPEIFADTFIPRILPSFQAAWPNVSIALELRDSRELYGQLTSGAVDIAFVTDGEVPGLDGPIVLDDPALWIAPLHLPIEEERPLPVITWRRGSNYERTVLTALTAASIPYRVSVRTQSIGGLISAVSANLGLTVITRSSLTDRVRVLEDAGLPNIAARRVRLETRGGTLGAHVKRLHDHVLDQLAPANRH